jgi:hypothetical protein
MNIQKELAASFPTKAAYESAKVVDAVHMNKTDVNGYPQDRTFQYMFPPVCIKTHWDAEAFSKHVLPGDLKVPLPVDPRPLVRNCTQYVTSAPVDPNEKANAALRRTASLRGMMPGGAASRGVPYEIYVANVNAENELYLDHPQDRCDENKWVASDDSDLYTNRAAPPRPENLNSFTELSRPIATVIPKGPYKCRAEADEVNWNRSARLFNNPTREDRVPGAAARSTEAPLSKRGATTGKVAEVPRVWPTRSVVFYLGSVQSDSDYSLINLASALMARDYEVTIFSPETTAIRQGITYHNLKEFVPNDVYSTVVMWGDSDLLANFQYRPTCKVLLLNLENKVEKEQICHPMVKETVDRIIVKSAFHRSLYNCYPWSKFEIVPSGLPVGFFTDHNNRDLPREKYRVLVTEYSEALVRFVNVAWLRIIATYPGAELHVWESAGDQKRKVMPALAGTAKGKGIVLHDRGSLNEMVRERFRSNVHVYLEDYDQVSCDAVRMSALAGCISIMPDRGVYKELRGIHVPGSVAEETVLIDYAKSISAVFKDPATYEQVRRRNQRDMALQGWNGTADRWLTVIKGLAGTSKPFSIGAYNSLFN